MGRKLNLSRRCRCAYEFRAVLVLLQSCSKNSEGGRIIHPARNYTPAQRVAVDSSALCHGDPVLSEVLHKKNVTI
jgi:hypothetical protein